MMTARILVVDDEPDLELLIRQKFRRQIRDGVYQFFFASNGVEALEALKANPVIDMVLTDINMPMMDGLTLLVKIKELNLLLKAVIVSAYGDLDNIRTAMNRGAFDFLTKPIDFQDLEITIQKTFELITELKRAFHEHDQLVAIHHELDFARDIQRSILPTRFPPFPDRKEVEIHAKMIAAREVGGDFYDFFFIAPDRLAFVIADVSGKGVPAALFMMISRTLLKAQAFIRPQPDLCLHAINNLLQADNKADMFVTLFYGILNTRTGELTYCNGGHNPPYLIHTDGQVEALEKIGGMALGIFSDRPYRAKTVPLKPGETVFLYTDGITEAENGQDEFFTEDRLIPVLQRLATASAQQILEGVIEEVKTFASGAPQSDDITALAIRFLCPTPCP